MIYFRGLRLRIGVTVWVRVMVSVVLCQGKLGLATTIHGMAGHP